MRALLKSIKEHNLVVATLILLVCLLGVYLAGQTTTLECTRAVGNPPVCILRTTWMDLFPVKEIRVDGLRGAGVNESCDDDGCTYRIVLTAAGGSQPLTYAYSSGYARKNETAQKINSFVADTSQTELVVEAGGKLLILIPTPFLMVAVYIFVLSVVAVIRDLL